MIDIPRLSKAFKDIFEHNEEDRWLVGLVGKAPASAPIFAVEGRANFIYVRVRNAGGAQTTTPARNDAGVPWSYGLPVRMRYEGKTLVIDGVVRREDLATTDAPPPSGVPVHIHDDRYFREDEHIDVSAGAGDAGKPIVLDAAGHVDATMLDSADVAAMIHAATLDAGPLDADEVPGLDSSASFGLIRWTWTTIKAFLQTFFDTIYIIAGGKAGGQSVHGGTAANEDYTIRGTAHATKTTSYVLIQPDGGYVIIGPQATSTNRLFVEETDANINPATFAYTATDTALPRGNVLLNRDQSANSAGGFRFNLTDNGGTVRSGAGILVGKEQLYNSADSTTWDAYLAFMVALNGTLVERLRINSAGQMGVGQTAPTARLDVLEATLGAVVQRLTSTATNDDVIQEVSQGRIATTDATVTTLQTIAIPASHACQLEVVVTAHRTGGAGGAAEDCAAYVVRGLFNQVAGAAAIVGQATTVIGESQAGWDCVFDVNSTNARLRVTGAASNNVTWHCTLRHWFLSS